jgi:ribonucleoside-diphosphate reductase alpha chain
MGFAEALIKMGIPYNSKEALRIGEEIMSFIEKEAFKASVKLAEERGSFPNIERSIYRGKAVRNATRTSIAPTGTISMIAGTSPGIEPIFAIAYVKKHILGERELVVINPLFLKYAGENLSEAQMEEALKTGSIQGIKGIPERIKRLFVTALDIEPEWHVRIQAVFQKHVDNSVSKTVNLRRDATVDDVKKVFMLGYELKLKGITVFRYGSKGEVIAPGVEHFKLENLYKCDTESCRIV